MNAMLPQPKWKTYDQAQAWFLAPDSFAAALRLHELPVPSWISLPLPTRRWGAAGWAWFRAPQAMRPGKGQVGTPDRWWAMDARNGALLAYAREAVVPALQQAAEPTAGEPKPADSGGQAASLDEQKSGLARLAAAIERVAEAFFEERWAPVSNRQEVVQALAFVTPPDMMRFYRALTPDFFAWLEQA